MKKVRVLVADDHAIVRMGLVSLLGTSSQFDVVGEAFDGQDAVQKALALRPDVVVMDIAMPRKDGIAATAELHEKAPDIKVLLLTTFTSSESIAQGLRAGAVGATLKNTDNDKLLQTVRAVAMGQNAVTPEIERMLSENTPNPALSPRQLEIIGCIAQGLTNREIAAKLSISLESVKSHIKILLEKLGATSRTEATSIAMKKHLLRT